MVHYFAFGSNMNIARLLTQRLAPQGVKVEGIMQGCLHDYELVFDKVARAFGDTGVANIRPKMGGKVYGTLNAIESRGLDILDHYEGVATNMYQRIEIAVALPGGGTVNAIAYQAQPPFDPSARPCREYLNHLLAGEHHLPPHYVEQLTNWPTADE